MIKGIINFVAVFGIVVTLTAQEGTATSTPATPIANNTATSESSAINQSTGGDVEGGSDSSSNSSSSSATPTSATPPTSGSSATNQSTGGDVEGGSDSSSSSNSSSATPTSATPPTSGSSATDQSTGGGDDGSGNSSSSSSSGTNKNSSAKPVSSSPSEQSTDSSAEQPTGSSDSSGTTTSTSKKSTAVAPDECYNFTCTATTDKCLSNYLSNRTNTSPVGTCPRQKFCKIKRTQKDDKTKIEASCVKESCHHQDFSSEANGGHITISCCSTSLCNLEDKLNTGHHSLPGFLPWIIAALAVLVVVV